MRAKLIDCADSEGQPQTVGFGQLTADVHAGLNYEIEADQLRVEITYFPA